ncbi:hypothetical protein OJF2_01500 [Aquisphaera giovannonii]|uniref:DUF1559 domain-containing protein n=1 Tax=Aquisphaera giovannonii TaxID=406548 RepID=A0A5B9VV88_9BACT|nr:DUF1559 domain-containing protein [Aquisphaera giovannonii]QEH31685.1 hypothetical protein OJF2_01500 [Aquisphaera giovannonii]
MFAGPEDDPAFPGDSWKSVAGMLLRVAAIAGCLGALVVMLALSFVSDVDDHMTVVKRATCVDNLRAISLALMQYASAQGRLPPACTVDAKGRRLHSWRTLILPYLPPREEMAELYASIDLSKPWDDPANRRAAASMPDAFRCPSAAGPKDLTTYLASAGPSAFLIPGKPRNLLEITDPRDATLAVIEAGREDAVPWMSPKDADEALILRLSPDSSLIHPGGMPAAMVDGSVRFLKATLPAAARRALISVDGDDSIIAPE